MKKTYLFPGQGSQKKGMGGDLFDAFPKLTKKADDILGYSIKELCLNDPKGELNQTQFTQPALYVVNALSFQEKIKDGKNKPDFVAGHSLGEYNALQAAGVMTFEAGLKLVKKRGELMSKAKNGGMAAIINSSEEAIAQILREASLSTIDIANLNSPRQIVISGLKEDIEKAQPFFEKANAMFIPLNTSGAFHSRYMKEAGKEFEKVVKKVKFSKAKCTVIANVNARPYRIDRVANNLVNQISSCVKWTESMEHLLAKGAMEFEELGVGNVLTKLQVAIKKAYDAKQEAKEPTGDVKGSQVKKESKVQEEKSKTPERKKEVVTTRPKGASAVSKKKAIAKTTPKPVPKSDKKEVPSADIMVAQWNADHSIGTKVKSALYEDVLQTRTEAIVLFGHRAAVYMEGYNGYFDLREIETV